MKKGHLICIQIVLSVFLISSFGFAAPTLNGVFDDADWNWTYTGDSSFSSVTTGRENANSGFTAGVDDFFVNGDAVIGPGGGGEDFNVKRLGLFIDDKYLYFGLQTGFDLRRNDSSYQAGDIGIDFSQSMPFSSGSNDAPAPEFGIDLSDYENPNAHRTELYEVSKWTESGQSPEADPFQIDFSESATHLATEENANGDDVDFYAYYNGYQDNISSYVMEGKIKLSLFAEELSYINPAGQSNDDYYVTANWTMNCGNDYLNKTILYTADAADAADAADGGQVNPIPEPATLLLFGMGLLGAGAYGRRRQKKEDN